GSEVRGGRGHPRHPLPRRFRLSPSSLRPKVRLDFVSLTFQSNVLILFQVAVGHREELSEPGLLPARPKRDTCRRSALELCVRGYFARFAKIVIPASSHPLRWA